LFLPVGQGRRALVEDLLDQLVIQPASLERRGRERGREGGRERERVELEGYALASGVSGSRHKPVVLR